MLGLHGGTTSKTLTTKKEETVRGVDDLLILTWKLEFSK
jgi:hypothetical protein